MKKYAVWLAILTLTAISSAHADQPTKPLAMTCHVTASCEVSIADNIPENSADVIAEALMTSGPVRERCAKRAVWRIDAGNDKNAARSAIRDNVVRMTINF